MRQYPQTAFKYLLDVERLIQISFAISDKDSSCFS